MRRTDGWHHLSDEDSDREEVAVRGTGRGKGALLHRQRLGKDFDLTMEDGSGTPLPLFGFHLDQPDVSGSNLGNQTHAVCKNENSNPEMCWAVLLFRYSAVRVIVCLFVRPFVRPLLCSLVLVSFVRLSV